MPSPHKQPAQVAESPQRPALDSTRPVLDDLPLYLPRLFYSFLGVVERKLTEAGLEGRLQPGMGHVLLRLYEQDNCIIKDIGRSLRVAGGTLTGLLNRMQRAGLIQCRRCKKDGRAVRVALTSLGRSLEPRVRAFHESVIGIVQGDLSAVEVQEAKRLLGRMLNSLRAAEESMRPDPSRKPGSTRTLRRPRTH
jgi:DNA-binding MarR family transcriptional regulator